MRSAPPSPLPFRGEGGRAQQGRERGSKTGTPPNHHPLSPTLSPQAERGRANGTDGGHPRLHHQNVRLQKAPPPNRKRHRRESREAHSPHLPKLYKTHLQPARDTPNLAKATRRSPTAATSESPHEAPSPTLPALDQVKGWRERRIGSCQMEDRGRP